MLIYERNEAVVSRDKLYRYYLDLCLLVTKLTDYTDRRMETSFLVFS